MCRMCLTFFRRHIYTNGLDLDEVSDILVDTFLVASRFDVISFKVIPFPIRIDVKCLCCVR